MNPHLYYALKYFCSQKVLGHSYSIAEDYWPDLNGICEFTVDSWECEGDKYREKFTYYYKGFDKKIEVCDNYTTKKLYEWVCKR